jgi:hypothetical protein
MFCQFVDEESQTIVGAYNHGLALSQLSKGYREGQGTLRIDDFGVFGDTAVRTESGESYLCIERSSNLGKWSGTTICGFALCPDMFLTRSLTL